MKRKVSLFVLLAMGYSMALGMSCIPNVTGAGAGPDIRIGLLSRDLPE